MQTSSYTATALALSNIAFTKQSRRQSIYSDRAGGVGWDSSVGRTNFLGGFPFLEAIKVGDFFTIKIPNLFAQLT
jgi:hypothetical protein